MTTDPTAARSKADASRRLADLAKTPRARDIFMKLAEEYEARARGKLTELVEAGPTLAPVEPIVSDASGDAPLVPTAPQAPAAPRSESDQWIAGLKAIRESAPQD